MAALDSALRRAVAFKFGQETVMNNWKFSALTESGDNFSSSVRGIDVTLTHKNANNKDFNHNSHIDTTIWTCIAKTSAQSDSEFFKIFNKYVFENEVEFFTKWAPEINAQLVKFGLKPLSTPECYGYSLEEGNEFILLKDMRLLNHSLASNSNRQMSLEECKTVIKELAKLHAVSHSIMKQKLVSSNLENHLVKKGPVQKIFLGLLDDRINSALSYLEEDSARELQETNTEMQGSTIEEKQKQEKIGNKYEKNSNTEAKVEDTEKTVRITHLKSRAISFLQSVQEDKLLFLQEIFGNTDTRFLSLCHGDTWTNNYLFSEDKTNCSLLDFQFVRIAPLSTDINYLLFTSLDEGPGNCKTLLKEYYSSYSTIAEAMKFKVEFTFPELEEEVQRTLRWGAVGGMIVLPMMRTKWTKQGQEGYRDRFLKLFHEID